MSLYLRSILYDLNIPQDAVTILYEDNDWATAMANADKPPPRSRHIDIKFYALQEWVERGLVILQRIDTSLNMADSLTKPLGRILFYSHMDYYMGFIPPVYSPKYAEVARKYLLVPSDSMPTPNLLAAQAANTHGPWEQILHCIHLMPLASFRSYSVNSLERGGFQIHTTHIRLPHLLESLYV